ncbi:hypothetical protein KEM52_000740 [Ascosphaera acerosa]|nr:hypothetical protein KEM52_000740 [Ascosphaera acerosa]
MSTVASPYLISRLGDPIFAILIGSSSAYLRIRREHKEKHPEAADDLASLARLGWQRGGRWLRGEYSR